MDGKIAEWIIEFLLRQNIDDRVLNSLLSTLPFPTDDPGLKKSLMLRRIGSDVSNESVDENILDFLEILEELDFRKSKPVLESMKAAYCAVAVDCTVRHLEEKTENNGKYLATVKRVWRERVSKLEKSERKSGLVSENLVRWKRDIFAAVWECDVRTRILSINTRNEALNSVRAYLAEAWRDMGPSFLELAAKRMHDMGEEIDGGGRGGAIVVFNGQPGRDMAESANMDCGSLEKEQNYQVDEPTSEDEETQEEQAPLGCQQVSPDSRHFGGAVERSSGGIRITEIEVVDDNISWNEYDKCPTPEVNKVHGSLKHSFAELRAVVRDPLPEALLIAQTVSLQMQRGKVGEDVQGEAHVVCDSIANFRDYTFVNSSRLENTSIYNGNIKSEDRVPCNASPINSPCVDSARSLLGCPHLNSPKRRKIISPLKEHEAAVLVRRRKRKKWSPLEEDTLRVGVQEFGKGNWKLILKTQKVHASVKTKHVAGRSRAMLRTPRRAKIVGELAEDISINKDSGLTHPPEVPGMQEKGLEFHFDVFNNIASVARRGAKNVNVPSATRENPSQRKEVQRSYPDGNDKDAGEAQKRNETDPELHVRMGSCMSRTRASLMDRNPTAKTYRWEDSPSADSLGASPTQSRTPNDKRRRVKRKWSPMEEETLKEGVARFGKGNWKFILNAFRNVLEGRTEVDLKDKWRNLTK